MEDEKKIDCWIKELQNVSQGLDQVLALTHEIPHLGRNIDKLGRSPRAQE